MWNKRGTRRRDRAVRPPKRNRRIEQAGVLLLAVVVAGLLPSSSPTVSPVVAAATLGQGAISIDFVGRGTPMGAAEKAGVVSRSRWNNAGGASRSTGLALVDETGAVTGATMVWRSDGVWSTGIADRAGNSRLMKGYLDTSSGRPTTVTISGLQSRAYAIYVYADGDNGGASRSGTYQVGGAGLPTSSVTLTDTKNTNFAGAFTRASNSAGNYVAFSVNATGFTVTATPGPASDGRKRAPINGLQIVPTTQAPDFSVSAVPGSQTVTPGAVASYLATVNALNGFSGSVSFGVTGLPAGATASFAPATVSGAGGTTLSVSTSPASAAGSSTLTITGTSGSLVRSASVTLVVAPPPASAISGSITPASAGAGATVALGGSAAAVTVADAAGAYRFSGLANGNYAVTPDKAGYVFSPASRIVAVNGASVTGVDFTAADATPTYSLSGTISPFLGGAGATLTLSGTANAVVTADASGHYVLSGLANGSYTITPANPGYAFVPASRDAAIADTSLTSLDFTALGPDRDRANSYDDEWEASWVSHARALLQTPGKTNGFVLEIGDSITHSMAYAAWARQGQGRTTEDLQAVSWARATSWGTGNFDVGNRNGWYLADADTTSQRGMTSSGGLSAGELLSGSGNGGPDMLPTSDAVAARQTLVDPTYTGNLDIDTLVAAFGDAQFAVVMLGTNDPSNPANLAALSSIVDKLEAQHIVAILSTIPPRNDGYSNDLNVQFNAAVRDLARARSLPLIDFYQEILLRRPGTTWFGTLISSDGVHPTGSGGGFSSSSNPYAPGGDPGTHTTGEAASNVGYLLRSWLTIQKLKEVKQHVIDGATPLF
jgi:hypothetical protein